MVQNVSTNYHATLIQNHLTQALPMSAPEAATWMRTYVNGCVHGLTAYAVWHDGTEVLGSSETPLSEVKRELTLAARSVYLKKWPDNEDLIRYLA